MKGVLKKTLAAGLSLLLCLGGVACTGRTYEPGENGLVHISAANLGYGTGWLEALKEVFQEEYGINVYIDSYTGSAGVDRLDTEIESLSSDTDLFFGRRGWFAEDVYKGTISAADGNQYPCLYADLSDVWEAVVDEGSELSVYDKIDPLYRDAYNIEGSYYALPWAGGVYGIVRNLDVWNALGLSDEDIPYTTDDLFDLCDSVKDTLAEDDGKACFIYALEEEYYTGWSTIFFAQYEGKKNAEAFMDGRDPNGERTQHVYTYDGQVEAMEVLERLIDAENGYQYSRSSSIDFTTMQGLFLRGEALFCVNGSWLEIEMGTNFDSANVDMIKTPVVSSIVNRLSFGNDSSLNADQKDDRLVELIKYVDAVDAGETPALPTYAAEATVENDIAIVTEARHYSYMAGGTDHQAYIPSYSKHIREAKEFLKFMYSDRGLQIYYESMQGAMLPAMLTEGSYDASGMQLSGFRESVNAAQLDGFVYDREPTARYFVLPHISACFENGVSPVVALRGGDSAMDIITDNRNSIGSRWETIAGLLGSDYINS